jgi:hypothetical protein
MRSFLSLAGFEYKKAFKRRSSVIALILAAAVACAGSFVVLAGTSYIDGVPYESHYKAMVKDREYARALSGRAIDETLLAETKDAYSNVPLVARYVATPEYQQYARPYLEIYTLMYNAYRMDIEGIMGLSEKDLQEFYQIRHNNVAADLRSSAISGTVKDALIELDGKIKTPFGFAYTGGFDNLFSGIYTIGIMSAFALAVCLAPMFAGEYSTHADQLVLSTKLGKTRLISAKIFTAVSLSVAFYLLLIALAFLLSASIYGLDGANAPFQLLIAMSVYPLTMLEAVMIFALCAFSGTLLIVALTLLLSSKFKSPFGVIIVISVLLFVPMMLHVPETMVLMHNLFSLLPQSMMAAWSVFSDVPYNIFGLVIVPYAFIPIFALLAICFILPFAWRGFRNHQIE